MKVWYVIVLLTFNLQFPKVAAQEEKNVNEIIRENIEESTDEFIENTKSDLTNYVTETVENARQSIWEEIQKNIKPEQILSSVTNYLQNILKSAQDYITSTLSKD